MLIKNSGLSEDIPPQNPIFSVSYARAILAFYTSASWAELAFPHCPIVFLNPFVERVNNKPVGKRY